MTQAIYVGTDHGGFEIKEALLPWLQEQAESVIDCGAYELEFEDDYPAYAQAVARSLAVEPVAIDAQPSIWGVLLCRSGVGMAMVANRYQGARAAVCRDEVDAVHARAHNNANILVLEGDHVSVEQARTILTAFLNTPFDGGRHARRLKAFAALGSKPSTPAADTMSA